MPLKIAFLGDSLSGKTIFSQKLSQKYGIILINPVSIIIEAFELNK
jgi:adenylate kinase family enzyme